MSVMKLNDEEFLFLAEMFLDTDLAKNENLGRAELYNIFRNLNVLGLCERYNDFFKETWENDKNFNYIFQQYNTTGISNISNKSDDLIKNLVKSGKIFKPYNNETKEISVKDTFNSLHYNSMMQNKFLSAFYKELYENEFLNIFKKPIINRTYTENELIRYYNYNILSENDKKCISESPAEFIRDEINTFNIFNSKDNENIYEICSSLSKTKALIDIANDDKIMKSFLTLDIVKEKISEYEKIGKDIAIELYNEKFAANDLNQDFYKNEIDKVLSENYVRKEEYNDVKICKTPAIYGKIGFDTNKDMYMSREHIRYDNKIHGIKKEQFYNLPKLLEEPAIIMKSISKEKSIVAIINDVDNNNMPVIASIYPNGNARYNFEKVDSNFITSVYGRNNFKNFISNAYKEKRLLFTDQKIIKELEKKVGFDIYKDIKDWYNDGK